MRLRDTTGRWAAGVLRASVVIAFALVMHGALAFLLGLEQHNTARRRDVQQSCVN